MAKSCGQFSVQLKLQPTIVTMGLRKLPLLPARHTMHLMVKAAVTVYVTAIENQQTA